METLNTDFRSICNQININAALPHLNKSRTESSYLKYYNQTTIDLVYEAFLDDILAFNYKKPILDQEPL